MKTFIKYSYTILLTLTCLITFPFVLGEITSTKAMEEVIESSTDIADNIQAEDIPLETDENKSSESNGIPSNEIAEEPSSEPIEKPPTLPLEEEAEHKFTTVSTDYFDNALFIGDSRTLGLYEYGNLKNATFFANNGMSVYSLFSSEVAVPNLGVFTLEELLNNKDFDKIYIMLGINELGYNFDNTIKKYNNMVELITDKEANAIIYLQANLHVSQGRSESDSIYNNNNIDKFNEYVSTLADNKTKFYLDINEVFDDENGNLDSKYTSDNTHVLGKHYADWCDWLTTKAVVK